MSHELRTPLNAIIALSWCEEERARRHVPAASKQRRSEKRRHADARQQHSLLTIVEHND